MPVGSTFSSRTSLLIGSLFLPTAKRNNRMLLDAEDQQYNEADIGEDGQGKREGERPPGKFWQRRIPASPERLHGLHL
jgi:hypothetical protein